MNTRIKEIRKSLNLTQSEFAEIIGFRQTSLSDMENGNAPITRRTILIICEKFDVNEEWLCNGRGEMFKKQKDKDFEQFYKTYSKLNKPLQDFLIECAKNLLDAQNKL